MMRLLKLAIVICIVPISVSAQTQATTDQPSEAQEVKAVVEQFYKLEAGGMWLGPGRWDELQNFFTDVGPQFQYASISVLKSYHVGEPNKIVNADGTVSYGVDVDTFEWGSINSFLRFVKARATGEPVERKVGETVFLTDRFVTTGALGKEEIRKVPLRWRMRDFNQPDTVDVDTAIRWVTEMRGKSNDPAVRYNAAKTLAILRNLSAAAPLPPQFGRTAPESPLKVAQLFVRLESGSLPDQWGELTSYFVETPKPQWNHVQVVDVLAVYMDMDGQTHEGMSQVAISVLPLGELDSSLRLSNYKMFRLPGNNSACKCDNYLGFTLVLSDKHWQIAADGTVKELDGPFAWRIEDTLFGPIITLNTAIRYVSQTRDKSTDPIIRKNAAKTLAMLKGYPKLSVRRHANDLD
jgi:hypothetical protein